MDERPVAGEEGQNGLFASATYDANTNEIFVKVANTSSKAQTLNLKIDGMGKGEALTSGRCIKLYSADLDKDNTLETPKAIQPEESALYVSGQSLQAEIEPNTFTIYILKK